ncbi:hypothetical protein CCAX7_43010 [Capsulimonas corticalis]|uniref:Uncharacterized protein n=1 Tax=Capsulimonas corticalis TaxID=2219043 RepID=A0A402CXL0_9BACT|nr:hypothetical protein CCAX7_43010 [Capsulimonas corticalis]
MDAVGEEDLARRLIAFACGFVLRGMVGKKVERLAFEQFVGVADDAPQAITAGDDVDRAFFRPERVVGKGIELLEDRAFMLKCTRSLQQQGA